jgi:hypothetical protein
MSHGKQRKPGASVGGDCAVQRRTVAPGKRSLTASVPPRRPGDAERDAVHGAEPGPSPAETFQVEPAREWFLGHFMPPMAERLGTPGGDQAPAMGEWTDRHGGGAAVQRQASGGGEAGAARPEWFLGHFMLPMAELRAARNLDPAPEVGAVQRKGGAAAEDARVQAVAESGIAGSGGRLPHLDAIQHSFGDHDLGEVKAHNDARSGEAAAALGASAYATGDHVAFRGTADLHTAAHEAAHVIQQREGVHIQGGVGRDGDEYERNADAVADRVVSGRSAADLLPDPQQEGGQDSSAAQPRPVQKKPGDGEGLPGPDAAVHDHAGKLRQHADQHDPSNPQNTLGPYEMYQVWLDLWSSRNAEAQPRVQELEEQLRALNPADFADKMDMFRKGRRDALGPKYEAVANEADLCTAQLSVMSEILGWLEARKAMGQRVTLDQVNRRALAEAEAKAIYVNTFMTVLLVGYPIVVAGRGSISANGPAALGAAERSAATADEVKGVTLCHGGPAESIASVRKGIRVDVNSPHPGRQQWGRGFYLADRPAAQAYAQQTESPAVVSYTSVLLEDLGVVLDVTAGAAKVRWDAFMNEAIGGYARRQLWMFQESRGAIFEEFLNREGLAPDVVVAPDGPKGQQVIIRTQAAADKLNSYLDPVGE